MWPFRRLLAVSLMFVAVVGTLVGLAGVVGAWVVKARWSSEALASLGRLDSDLRVADDALREIGPHLVAGRENLGAISAAGGSAVQKLGQPRIVELAQGVQGGLLEIDDKVKEVNDRLTQVEQGVNKVAELVSRLPGVDVPVLDVKLLDGVSGLLIDANDRLTDLADEATGGQVSLYEEMAGMEETVQQLQGDLRAIESLVGAAGNSLAAARDGLRLWAEKLPAMLQQAAIALTIALLWFVVGQAGLFMWAWSLYRQESLAVQ
jgi:uncharacterized phage infection (PIP) family protein YhgE